MTYPFVPEADAVARHFAAALAASERLETPYRRWSLKQVLPIEACTAILLLPVAPPYLGDTDGTRNSYNAQRCFFTPNMRADFAICENLAEAMQTPPVARQFAETCAIDPDGCFVRIEYIQDIDGMWLEPHRDIKEKVFSMVIYLCTGPEAAGWGTDIYDDDIKWIGRSSAEFDSATIFKAGPNTWHGFEKRKIVGVRRLMEINYVRDWRDREQLAFPDRPIRV
jgi:hypothetical protein